MKSYPPIRSFCDGNHLPYDGDIVDLVVAVVFAYLDPFLLVPFLVEKTRIAEKFEFEAELLRGKANLGTRTVPSADMKGMIDSGKKVSPLQDPNQLEFGTLAP